MSGLVTVFASASLPTRMGWVATMVSAPPIAAPTSSSDVFRIFKASPRKTKNQPGLSARNGWSRPPCWWALPIPPWSLTYIGIKNAAKTGIDPRILTPGRPAGQADDRLGEAGNGRNHVVERHRAARGLADDDGEQVHVAPVERIERREGVADSAEIAAGDQDQRQAQRHHHVEDGALAIERYHDSTDTFDEQDIAALRDGVLAERHHLIDVDTAAFAGGREIRRDRIAEPPRRSVLDFVRGDRQA